MPGRLDGDGWGCSRRQWLLGALVAAVGRSARGGAGAEGPADPSDELAPVFAKARALKLSGFRSSRTEHYAGAGDAPDAYRDMALRICESLGKVYRQVFTDKGFPAEFPDRRLTVVTLKDRTSYAAYLGESPGEDVGGHYDVDANQLVIFDFQADSKDRAPNARRVNTFTLVHEALHQLTFNTGLLDRRGDVPVAVSEGLATYGELWQHTNQRATLGVVSKYRLQVFLNQAEAAVDWIPFATLLTDDGLFEAEQAQLAYAESWVFVHYFLKTPSKLPAFRAYLAAIRARRDRSHRLEDATQHLGELAVLNRELRKYAMRSLRA